jgi:uncharacterized phage protein
MTGFIIAVIGLAADVLQFLISHPLVTAVLAVPAYMLLTLAHPVHKCPRCRGTRVIKKRGSHRTCHWCKGHGRTRRLGGQMFHRLVWDHAGPWITNRYHDVLDRLRDGAS